MAQHNGEWKIERFGPENYGSNTYLLVKGKEAALIDAVDAGDDAGRVIEQMGVRLKYLLLTHGTEAAAGAIPLLKERFGGEVCIHAMDQEGLAELGHPMEADILLEENDSLEIQGSAMAVLHTPGHTYGSLSFYVEDAAALFSGMALMKGGYGKIWGPDTMRLMMMSLRRLNNNIPSEVTIYPGQGPVTKIAQEGWINCLRSM